jgi:WD40 repeat protein
MLESEAVTLELMGDQVTVYKIPISTLGTLQTIRTFTTDTAPIASLVLHPTTPDVLALARTNGSLEVHGLSSTSNSPTIKLDLSDPKGFWSISWSPDGQLLAAIGRSGTLYTFDPRNSTSPTAKKPLSIQALKPARVSWVTPTSLFVTSFSKTRNRQYSLYAKPNLTEVFTNQLDTSPSPLIPTIDHSRELIYLAGKGDMTLRQIECTGPMGFQETLHSLPHAITSAGLALGSATEVDVMAAEIGKIWMGWADSRDGGEVVAGVSVKVPRRQLIDFHADLYPEAPGMSELINTRQQGHLAHM